MAVVIVGSGPTGATLAYLLATRGIEVILVEASGFERVFRGEGLMPGGLQALEQMELLDLLATLPTQQIQAWEFVVNHQTVVRAVEPESLGQFRPTIISQSAFLEALLRRAQTHPNLRFVRGSVQHLSWQAEGKRVAGVTVRLPDQSTEQIRADLVIGADGRGSTLRRLADLPLTKLDYAADLLWFRLPVPLPTAADSKPAVPDRRHTFYGFIRGSESFGAYTAWDASLKLAYLVPRRNPSATDAPTPSSRSPRDWAAHLAPIAPDWFAAHLRHHAAALEPPVFLNVVFGHCPTWHRPGLLLLGDAAHPMAPIRAQGINLAFRDVIVATNRLVPLLQSPGRQNSDRQDPGRQNPDRQSPDRHQALDAVLPLIQAEREPEIQRCQTLQRQEQRQADLLCRFAILQGSVSRLAPLLQPAITHRWMARQTELRFGTQPIRLLV
jgi:2-polyprenyl-6-methoxyphenol hydroxylase-like FAD-dependent oxidoreductase